MTDLKTIPATVVTPLLSKCLGSQELAKHRALVGFELEVLSKKVDRFGWDRDRGSAAQDRQVLDWMNALQDYPLPEVQAACVMAVQENPNKLPNEGHIKAIIIRERGRVVASQPKPVEPYELHPEPTKEQRDTANALVRQFARRAAE